MIGAGGHASSVLAIESIEQWDIVGYASPIPGGEMPIPYLGTDADILKNYSPTEYQLILGLSYFGRHVDLRLRQEVIARFRDYTFCRITARSSRLKTDMIGPGTLIFENSIVNTQACIGQNCVINTGAIVEHHCRIGNNVQIGPGSILLGGATVGDNTFVGAGTIIRDSTQVGSNLVIPMGAKIVADTYE